MAAYLDKYTRLVILGNELGSDAKEAATFCKRIELSFRLKATSEEILGPVQQLEPDDIFDEQLVLGTPEIDRIAKSLGLQSARAANIGKLFESQLGLTASNRFILQDLDQLEGEPKPLPMVSR